MEDSTGLEIQKTEQDTSLRLELHKLTEQAKNYIQQSRAENTYKSYRVNWNDFEAWCRTHHLQSLPAEPETVALYITDLATRGKKASTIQRRLSTISQRHQSAGFETPTTHSTVKNAWKGIRRTIGVAEHGKAPLLIEDIRRMVRSQSMRTKAGIRNRALLLIGFAGAFRRSELVGLDVEDLDFRDEGLVITVQRSKTDQEGQGLLKGIPYGSDRDTCPIRSLQLWLETAGITSGAIFRSVNKGDKVILHRRRNGEVVEARLGGRDIARIVKKCAQRAGLDPQRYAGHSLRAGFATTAAERQVPEQEIMDQTGHKSLLMLRRYIRKGNVLRNNAAAKIGL